MKMKKIMSVLLCVILIISLIAGCGSKDTTAQDDQQQETQSQPAQSEKKEDNAEKTGEKAEGEDVPSYLNKEGFPIVKEPVTLKFMVKRTAVQPPHEEIYVWQEYEKMTGVKIEWINVPDKI